MIQRETLASVKKFKNYIVNLRLQSKNDKKNKIKKKKNWEMSSSLSRVYVELSVSEAL